MLNERIKLNEAAIRLIFTEPEKASIRTAQRLARGSRDEVRDKIIKADFNSRYYNRIAAEHGIDISTVYAHARRIKRAL